MPDRTDARREDRIIECLRVRCSPFPILQAANRKKLDMTTTYDKVNGDIKVRFDRQPVKETDEYDFVEHMKAQYNFKWRGWAEQGKWQTDRHAVICFRDKTFRARLKLAVTNMSFFRPNGEELDLDAFVNEVEAFDPDAVDDDLSTLGKSSVPPSTPGDKRQRPS